VTDNGGVGGSSSNHHQIESHHNSWRLASIWKGSRTLLVLIHQSSYKL
jgi:hypothetical protein